jgi:hypothetical protein
MLFITENELLYMATENARFPSSLNNWKKKKQECCLCFNNKLIERKLHKTGCTVDILIEQRKKSRIAHHEDRER